jgi:Legionella pneumophila major outer membrane protein precursor
MGQQFRLLALGLLVSMGSLTAGSNAACDLLDINLFSSCGYLTFYGDALYMKPDNSDFPWVKSPLPDPEDAMLTSLVPDYHWGFRLGANYATATGCSFMDISGLYVWGSDHVEKRGPELIPNVLVGGAVDHVRARFHVDYWNIDLKFGRYFWQGCGLGFYAFVGARYANMEEKPWQVSSIETTAAITTLDIRYKFDGAGPQTGVGAEYCIFRNLNLVGQVSTMGLIGARRTHVGTQNVEGERGRYCFDRATIISPAVDIRLALNYSLEMCCMIWEAELGWELDHYWNAASRFNLFSSADSVFQREVGDVGFSGPYLSFRVGF